MEMHPSYRTRSGLTEWAEDVLSQRVDAVIGTINRDGSIHMVPVSYAFDGERLLIASGSGSRKVRNIEADPRSRVLVQAPPDPAGGDGWVAADGRAQIVRGEEAQRLNEATIGRYLTEEGKAAYADTQGMIMDVTIVLAPDRWQTWHDSKFYEPILAKGYTEEEISRWFLPEGA